MLELYVITGKAVYGREYDPVFPLEIFASSARTTEASNAALLVTHAATAAHGIDESSESNIEGVLSVVASTDLYIQPPGIFVNFYIFINVYLSRQV